jgi:hypothetical protein
VKVRCLAALAFTAAVLAGCSGPSGILTAKDVRARLTCQAIATELRHSPGMNPIRFPTQAQRIEWLSRTSSDARLELGASRIVRDVKHQNWSDEFATLLKISKVCKADGFPVRVVLVRLS